MVIATLVIGFAVSTAFLLWEWKGAKVPLVPGMSRPEQQSTANNTWSLHIQEQGRKWRVHYHVHQRMEFCDTSLLYTNFLPVGVWLLSRQSRRASLTYYLDAE